MGLPWQSKGAGSIPDQGTKIPHATQCGKIIIINKKNKNRTSLVQRFGSPPAKAGHGFDPWGATEPTHHNY